MAPDATRSILLPTNIVSPTDIARLSREIDSLDEYFQEQQIRTGGTPNAMPRLSKLMDQLASDNQINLLVPQQRQTLKQLLDNLHKSAPVMHISFSVDPPGAYVQKIVEWLRQNIHQHILVTVGLQPNIGAGCIVRTTNRMFDFSLREYFAQKRPFFIEKLHQSIMGGEEFVTQTNADQAQTQVATQTQPVASAQDQIVQQTQPVQMPTPNTAVPVQPVASPSVATPEVHQS